MQDLLHLSLATLLLFSLRLNVAVATTEWFGDLRAHMNPPKAPPFYDVAYEDTEECPFGMQSNAIPEYVYFGEMIASRAVTKHTECLRECLATEGCKAVNYFEPLTFVKNDTGFCEILKEDQRDNPILMRPFHKAIYYEQIHCIISDEGQSGDERRGEGTPTHSSIANDTKFHQPQMGGNSSSGSESHDSGASKIDVTSLKETNKKSDEEESSTPETENTQLHDEDPHSESTPRPSSPMEGLATGDKRALALFKKLAAKVHEFNVRFRSDIFRER